MLSSRVPLTFAFAICALQLSACEEQKKPAPAAAASAAAAPPAPPTAAPTSAAAPAAEEKPKGAEPLKGTDLALTDARRSKIEQAVPEAKGFVEASDIEKDLQKKKIKSDDEGAAAAKAFDGQARGKWVLFRGNITNMKPDSFELGVTYTPQIAGDAIGMSRKFFLVGFKDVKGYEVSAYKGGQLIVVLAKYLGNKQASPGYDLHALGDW
jgi:hypothetical protein